MALSLSMLRGGTFIEFLCKCPYRRCLVTKLHFISQSRGLLTPAISLPSLNTDSTDKKINGKSGDKKKPLWYYDNKGIRQRKLDQLMRKSAEIVENDDASAIPDDVRHMKKVVQTLTAFKFDNKEINRLLFTKPRLLELTKQKLFNQLNDLHDYGYSMELMKKMILKSPGLLLVQDNPLSTRTPKKVLDESSLEESVSRASFKKPASIESDKSTVDKVSLQQRFMNLQEMSLTPRLSQSRCTYLVQKCPELLTISNKSTLQSKLQNLRALGFNEQLLFELVMKYPNILTHSEDAVREKVNFITHEIGGNLTLFIKFPRAFSASLRRIKDRHAYLLKEGFLTTKSFVSEKKLRALVLTTDKDFIYRVTNTNMKDYKLFQQELRRKELEDEFGTEIPENRKFQNALENELLDNVDDENDDERDEDSWKEGKYVETFSTKRYQSDDDFYNTPFAEINHQNMYEETGTKMEKPRTIRGYRPKKRKELRKNDSKK